ncbi:hypothetical protein [Gemmobacter sp. 24YEA27]|uniref:hypothetical protein n=1 Tax=Gemmobacter sp. 24YEA27 TaxID=3040672 RepID=UPI0024B368C6|nr:hypothetical protein [Gemmobacter sp. 24YEA27]
MTFALLTSFADGAAEMRSWLRALHQMPELGYESIKARLLWRRGLPRWGLSP